MQKENGEFFSTYNYQCDIKPTDFVSIYYPGEATLALTRLYNTFKEECNLDTHKWLTAVRKSAHYLISRGDKKLNKITQDHWLMIAISELYPVTKDEQLSTYCFIIADEMIRNQYTEDNAPFVDFIGGKANSNPPRVTPTATNTEGLVAAWKLAKYISEGFETEFIINKIRKACMLAVKFQLKHQFTPEKSIFLPDPDKAVGGFFSSSIDYSIRIDYVQHNISSLLGMAKLLHSEIKKQL